MSTASNTFNVRFDSADGEYLHVDVGDLGTVIIKQQPDGIVVDIYPIDDPDEPIAGAWAQIHELKTPDGEDAS